MEPQSAALPSLRDLGYFEPTEVAALLGANPLTLRNWRAKKIGPPSTKIHGQRIVYPIDGVKKWLLDRTTKFAGAAPTLIEGHARRRSATKTSKRTPTRSASA